MKALLRAAVMAAIVVPLVSPPLYAAGVATGKIYNLKVRDRDGLIFFYIDGDVKNKPGCALYDYWMIKDENSATGKRQYAKLLAADLADKTVEIKGHGTCTRWRDGEDVDEVTIK